MMSPMQLVTHDITKSTNDDAKKLAQEGAPEGTIILAHKQTAGRGRQGNDWESKRGNLFMSVILRPKTDALQAGQLSFVAAVILKRVLSTVLPEDVNIALKWPNDVLLNDKKVAGILLESQLDTKGQVDWIVMGLGVNILHAPEGAARLCDHGVDTTAEELCVQTANEMMSLYQHWQDHGFAAVREEWLGHAYRIGKNISVRLPDDILTAKFTSIDDQGCLLLAMNDGSTRRITSAEVFA